MLNRRRILIIIDKILSFIEKLLDMGRQGKF